jgi:hypothetical protein
MPRRNKLRGGGPRSQAANSALHLGLENGGNTCYVNVTLHLMFLIFRVFFAKAHQQASKRSQTGTRANQSFTNAYVASYLPLSGLCCIDWFCVTQLFDFFFEYLILVQVGGACK